VPQDDALQSRG